MSQACREKWAVHIKHRKSAGEKPLKWDTYRPAYKTKKKIARDNLNVEVRIAIMLKKQRELLEQIQKYN